MEINKKDLSDLLLSFSHYQNYVFYKNGDPSDNLIDDILDHIIIYSDINDIKIINNYLEKTEYPELLNYLYCNFDIYSEIFE